MVGLGSKWAGHAYGTNVGNIYLELNAQAANPQGILRFMDRELGLAIYNVEGTFEEGRLHLSGTPAPGQEVELGQLTIAGQLNSNGQLVGDWQTSLGTAGTFGLFPHDRSREEVHADPSAQEEQLHTATRKVGAVRLYATDVLSLISALRSDFSQSTRVIVTYRAAGTEVSRYADDFTRYFDRIGELQYLKLNLSEPERQGINRTAMIELNGGGENIITTQSVQAAWAMGKAEGLSNHLSSYSKPLVTSFRRYGLNANTIIFLIAISLLPELELIQRIIFLFIISILIVIIGQVHTRLIKNATIKLAAEKPGALQRSVPQVISWSSTVISGFIAALAYGILKGEIDVGKIMQSLHILK